MPGSSATPRVEARERVALRRDHLAHPDEQPLHGKISCSWSSSALDEDAVLERRRCARRGRPAPGRSCRRAPSTTGTAAATAPDRRARAWRSGSGMLGSKAGAFVAVHGDEVTRRSRSSAPRPAVLVGVGAVDDEEGEVVVVVDLGALAEVLRVLDGEGMEPEHLAQHLEVARRRAGRRSSQKNWSLASSCSTVSRLKCISPLPWCWTTWQSVGPLRAARAARLPAPPP